MTISGAGLQGIQSGVSLLNRAAANVLSSTETADSSTQDQVTLSEDAVALLQARNQVAAGAHLIGVESNLEKSLLDAVG